MFHNLGRIAVVLAGDGRRQQTAPTPPAPLGVAVVRRARRDSRSTGHQPILRCPSDPPLRRDPHPLEVAGGILLAGSVGGPMRAGGRSCEWAVMYICVLIFSHA